MEARLKHMSNRIDYRNVSFELLEQRRLLSAGQLEPNFGSAGAATFDFGGHGQLACFLNTLSG